MIVTSCRVYIWLVVKTPACCLNSLAQHFTSVPRGCPVCWQALIPCPWALPLRAGLGEPQGWSCSQWGPLWDPGGSRRGWVQRWSQSTAQAQRGATKCVPRMTLSMTEGDQTRSWMFQEEENKHFFIIRVIILQSAKENSFKYLFVFYDIAIFFNGIGWSLCKMPLRLVVLDNSFMIRSSLCVFGRNSTKQEGVLLTTSY